MKIVASIIAMSCSCLLLDGAARAHSCSDTDLHKALLAHDKAGTDFRNKMGPGYARSAEPGDVTVASQRNEHLDHGAAATIDAIRSHLRALDYSGATFALVYDPTLSGCVWLLGPYARPIAARSRWHPKASAIIRDAIGVTARSAPRLPRLRIAGAPPPASTQSAWSRTRPSTESSPESVPESIPNLTAIRDQLLPPRIARQIEASAHRLLILPAHGISSVPFAALPMHQPGKHLIDYAMPIIVPGVDALFFWVKAPPQPDTGALVVGDPDVSADPLWLFPRLPGARHEAQAVAQLTGTKPLLGSEATLDAVAGGLAQPDLSLIYFATHGMADGGRPMDDNFLALRNAHLKGTRIKHLTFSRVHPLIVMSACHRAPGQAPSSASVGLARAWIYAGASQVLVSHWNVDDWTTARLMELFIKRRRQGMNAEDALWQAMLEARRKIPDPAVWAAFGLFGYPQPVQG